MIINVLTTPDKCSHGIRVPLCAAFSPLLNLSTPVVAYSR